MKWSWKLGRIAGIDVYVHTTFLLLLGWIGVSQLMQDQSLTAALGGVAFVLALFLCVVLHEYGHALVARRYGIATHDITLLPIGGVARLERMPDDPRQELWVALAGPAVNVVLAAALFGGLVFANVAAPVLPLAGSAAAAIESLLAVNVSLVLFNLLPAFPMDGGRVLRALLALRMDYTRSTQIAARVGQGMAILFGIAGLFTNPMLVFIALFVWVGAAQEARMVQMRSAWSGYRPQESPAGAGEAWWTGPQTGYPLTAAGRMAAMIMRTYLFRERGPRGVTIIQEPQGIAPEAFESTRSARRPMEVRYVNGRYVIVLS